jgi:hypothetical protein
MWKSPTWRRCLSRNPWLQSLEHPHPYTGYPPGRAFGGPGHDRPPHRYPGNGSFKSGLAKKLPCLAIFQSLKVSWARPKAGCFMVDFVLFFFLRAVRFLFLARWRVVGVDIRGSEVVVAGTLAESQSNMMLNSKEFSAGGLHREWAMATN